jgi:hypothetical protein
LLLLTADVPRETPVSEEEPAKGTGRDLPRGMSFDANYAGISPILPELVYSPHNDVAGA